MRPIKLVPTTARSKRTKLAVLATAALTLSGVATAIAATSSPTSTPETNGIFSDSLQPRVAADSDRTAVELGIRFSPSTSGEVTALQYYQGAKAQGVTRATLWTSRGTVLARQSFSATSKTGWRTVKLDKPVQLTAGSSYVASYQAPKGGYPLTEGALRSAGTRNGFALPASAGVFRYGATSKVPTQAYQGSNYLVDIVFKTGSEAGKPTAPPTEPTTPPVKPTTPPTEPTTPPVKPTTPPTEPTTPPVKPTTPPTEPTTPPTEPTTPPVKPTTPPTEPTTPPVKPSDGKGTVVLGRSFPNEATTGVPAGTQLTKYTGPCTIQTNNVVIDKKIIDCDMRVLAQNLKITNSVLNGPIYSDPDYFNGSFTMTDSEVRMPMSTGTGVGDVNFTLTRVEVTGGSRSVNCAADCTVQDSYLHGQYTDKRGIDHESAIRMGSNSTIRHNNITCDSTPVPPDAGCSAALTGYGDFATVQKNTIDNNLIDGGPFGSMGYCAYGGSTTGKPYSAGVNNIKFTNNIFMRGTNGKCGIWGPITSFDSKAPGNVWTNNLWEDGKPVAPSM